jgi:hypothetical protein
MSAPGTRLRAFAQRFCNPQTMERLIDPVIADQQHEYALANGNGRAWRARWARVAGCIAFWKVVTMVLGRALTQEITTSEEGAVGRTIRFAGIATTVITVLFVWVPLRQVLATLHLSTDSMVRLIAYLLPQALPIAIPIGIVFGVLSGCAATRRSQRLSVLLMLAASLISLPLVGWLMPNANQAFRETMFALINGFEGHFSRGVNELTLGQLWSTDTYQFHFRLALAGAPIVLGLFSLALVMAIRGRTRAIMAGVAALAICFVYYILLDTSHEQAHLGYLPAAVAAWAPNLFFAALALLLHLRTRGRSAAGPSRPDDGRRSADQPVIPPA